MGLTNVKVRYDVNTKSLDKTEYWYIKCKMLDDLACTGITKISTWSKSTMTRYYPLQIIWTLLRSLQQAVFRLDYYCSLYYRQTMYQAFVKL